jgi:hypothetical protein
MASVVSIRPPNGAKIQVDSARGQLTRLQIHAVPEHDGLAQKSRLNNTNSMNFRSGCRFGTFTTLTIQQPGPLHGSEGILLRYS